jgi:hypothetical protein
MTGSYVYFKTSIVQVISFNDRKCSLGSIGEAQITSLKNQVNILFFKLVVKFLRNKKSNIN